MAWNTCYCNTLAFESRGRNIILQHSYLLIPIVIILLLAYVDLVFSFFHLQYLQSLNPPVLIFVQKKERAVELYGELAFDNIRVDVIHSDLSQEEVVLNPFEENKFLVGIYEGTLKVYDQDLVHYICMVKMSNCNIPCLCKCFCT
jgi:hypothetical protein